MTHRQYLVWQAWLEEEWDRPNRSDFYAMSTAAEVRMLRHVVSCLFGGTPPQVNLADLKLSWKPSKPMDPVLENAWMMGKWMAAVGYNPDKPDEFPSQRMNRR